MIKESEVLERIGAGIDKLDADGLATLHNLIADCGLIRCGDIELEKGWRLIPIAKE